MEHFDLVIVGSGSGNMIPSPDMDDWEVAVVEEGAFGGTCLNVGCIPSKMLVYAADTAERVRHAERYGVHATVDSVDWPSIVDRVFGRIDPIADGGEQWRAGLENFEVIKERGTFVGHKRLAVGDREITADRFVLAAGARPVVAPIPGLDEVGFHTSDTIMRVPTLPRRLLVIGGGYIAAELGHVFGSLGSEVTMVVRSAHMLRDEDEQISAAATELYAQRFDLRLEQTVRRVRREGTEIVAELEHRDGDGTGGATDLRCDLILVAIGRRPNSDLLGVEATGVGTHPDGRVVVDETMTTGVEGIWALGDLTSPFQLKHLANAEARVVAHNVVHPDRPRSVDHSLVPHAVFASPQIAGVGLREQDLRDAGTPYVRAVVPFAGTAYGWAMEDTTSFVKLLADPATRRLLGAHLMGPQASTLIQQAIQGMRFGQTVDEMARGQMYIHPALTEVVEVALLELVNELDSAGRPDPTVAAVDGNRLDL